MKKTEHVKGTIKKGETIIFAGLNITLIGLADSVDAPKERHEWFYLKAGEHIEPGQYRLEVEDGRSAEIAITHVNHSDATEPVSFQLLRRWDQPIKS